MVRGNVDVKPIVRESNKLESHELKFFKFCLVQILDLLGNFIFFNSNAQGSFSPAFGLGRYFCPSTCVPLYDVGVGS